ncbi:glycosyltransferase family 39 protein [Leptothoe kymatousa]|uniref:Glycosyltransferase family 39 protein n=1 Tax=Leptothoe kymatousa TAU-MAC 1615 TaxID=2364775 RepID=A0ABS5Y5U9_9CYAN|nr:glycosyltransferase family 39 protein [Leptothoe kymatousa]MBT9313234.1 glycosyltransferase family 39 protein [Leptothoe kymatousa TAU-MAC 1615]
MQATTRVSGAFKAAIAIAICLGIFFRFFHLDRKVYWFDEVYSTTRIAGYTIAEVRAELFQNQILPAPTLQKYQRPKPNSTLPDTVDVLIQEDAKHPPLYYGLANVWMRRVGHSIAMSRLLPALISLVALPLMFALGLELFSSQVVAALATVFLALSPFDILFAQTVRQYSLLTVIILGSSWALLRAMRLHKWQAWAWYAVACALGWYTHLFFSLTAMGHGVYVVMQQCFSRSPARSFRHRLQPLISYALAVGCALLLYIPWMIALLTGGERTYASSNWLSSSVDFLYLLKFWILSFSSLFFDLDVGFNHPGTYLLRLPFIALIAIALYQVQRHTSKGAGWFILTSVLVPFLALAVPDIVFGGKRSAITRYLICSFPGIQLAVAYLFGKYLLKRRIWQGILAIVLTGSIASCTVSAYASSWWSKGVSVANGKTAAAINRLEAPLVISDQGNSSLNQGNLISLSYRLDDDVRLLLIDPDAIATGLALVNTSDNVLLYAPSSDLRRQAEAAWGALTHVDPPEANLLERAQPTTAP